MSESQHTPEDMYTRISSQTHVSRDKVKEIILAAGFSGRYEATRHEKAASNACTGIPTEALEAGVIDRIIKYLKNTNEYFAECLLRELEGR